MSVGSALSRVALAAVMSAAHEMKEQGTFRFAEAAVGSVEANQLMRE